jgi:CTP:molybdopterin cytidylyltransferase MocA
VPAVFEHSLFEVMLSLGDGCGAEPLIAKLGDNVAILPFSEGVVDIDTPADLNGGRSQIRTSLCRPRYT